MVKKTKKIVVSKSKKEEVKKLPKTRKLTAEEKYWTEVDQQSHYLIADLLNQSLPLPNLKEKKNLDLDRDRDYQELLFAYDKNYSENLPDSKTLAEQIAYDYLLLVVKSLLRNLSDFDCHLGFEELYE